MLVVRPAIAQLQDARLRQQAGIVKRSAVALCSRGKMLRAGDGKGIGFAGYAAVGVVIAADLVCKCRSRSRHLKPLQEHERVEHGPKLMRADVRALYKIGRQRSGIERQMLVSIGAD